MLWVIKQAIAFRRARSAGPLNPSQRISALVQVLNAVALVAVVASCLGCNVEEMDSAEELAAKAEADREARLEAAIQRQTQLFTTGHTAETSREGYGALSPKKIEEKQISVKRGRAFMREIHAALGTEEAKAQIAAARAKVSSDASALLEPGDDDHAPHDEKADRKSALFGAVGAVVDKLTRAVVFKYEFEGGFSQAMASVANAAKRKGDKELTAAMQDIAEIFSEEPHRFPDLEAAARKFRFMSASERDDVIKRAEDMHEKASSSKDKGSIHEYLMAMRGTVSEGNSYAKEAVVRAVTAARETEKKEKRKLTQEERDMFNARVETLWEFLDPVDERELEQYMDVGSATKTDL